MSQPTNGKPRCAGCGRDHMEVRPLKLVALPENVNLCGECLELAYEIAHDYEGGSVRVAVKDLEELRCAAREAGYFRHWLDMVRDSVERADVRLKELSAAQPSMGGEAEYASWTVANGAGLDGRTKA